ncbi:MAG: SpoIIE family protein phosphatase [Pseudobacter sp.]|uniref:SpoIIE family protein phosphatase n=1 Tax=Pseudobacter sp. TaxID=2045420 RepID=UPI003F7D76DF
MANRTHVVFKANDRSYFAILKKEIHQLAVAAGFNEKKIGELDIVVSEVVSNLVKHAGGGEIWVAIQQVDGVEVLELISVDNGPGMTDVNRMMNDGVSTRNTLGHGLGSIKRLSDFLQVYSMKDWGTVMLIRFYKTPKPAFAKPLKAEVRSVVLPKPGEMECGDGAFHKNSSSYLKLLIGDGLGHGVEAAKAVVKAGEAFLQCASSDVVEILREMNVAVKKTRGLVGTVAVYDWKLGKWQICGVGNISSRFIGNGTARNNMPYNGIIGLNVPRSLNPQFMNHENGQVLVMASDGLKSKLDILKYPGIWRYDLSVLCAVLIKDFGRFTDDSSVLACKINI